MKAVYNISYGVYVLTANSSKQNGCITNTLCQVTTNPNRVTITVNKQNFTNILVLQVVITPISLKILKTLNLLKMEFLISQNSQTHIFLVKWLKKLI